MTTEPFAVVMAQKVAADEMNNFAMVIRKELGKTEYTSDDSKKAVLSSSIRCSDRPMTSLSGRGTR